MKLPCKCPSCDNQLKVKSLSCDKCETEVTGTYNLPVLARLLPDEQSFMLKFIKNSGSLKDMAKDLGLSYPTVRNLLDDIIKKIKTYENQ